MPGTNREPDVAKDAPQVSGKFLAATRIDGVQTNLAFQAQLLADADFVRGGVDTGFLARRSG